MSETMISNPQYPSFNLEIDKKFSFLSDVKGFKIKKTNEDIYNGAFEKS